MTTEDGAGPWVFGSTAVDPATGAECRWGFESTAKYTGERGAHSLVAIPMTLEETTPPVCPYCGGTFGADDVRCRGCGADVKDAAQ